MKKTHPKNRFIEEIQTVTQGNPNVDMNLIREWRELAKILERVPPMSEPEAVKLPRLQPIPLQMFNR